MHIVEDVQGQALDGGEGLREHLDAEVIGASVAQRSAGGFAYRRTTRGDDNGLFKLGHDVFSFFEYVIEMAKLPPN